MKMEERRIVDYFVMAGLPDNPEPLDDTALSDAGHLKASHSQAPITDIGVVFPSLGETVPESYELVRHTPTGTLLSLFYRILTVCFRSNCRLEPRQLAQHRVLPVL